MAKVRKCDTLRSVDTDQGLVSETVLHEYIRGVVGLDVGRVDV